MSRTYCMLQYEQVIRYISDFDLQLKDPCLEKMKELLVTLLVKTEDIIRGLHVRQRLAPHVENTELIRARLGFIHLQATGLYAFPFFLSP